jgi:hypothetical protein
VKSVCKFPAGMSLISSARQYHAMDDITGVLGVLNVISTIRPLARGLVASDSFMPKVGMLYTNKHAELRCTAVKFLDMQKTVAMLKMISCPSMLAGAAYRPGVCTVSGAGRGILPGNPDRPCGRAQRAQRA